MTRVAFLIVFFSISSAAEAATLVVQTVSQAGGVGADGYLVGGSDSQIFATNTADGDASASFTSQISIPGGSTSGFASGNVATGEMKAKISSNVGTYYGGVDGVAVYAAEGGGFSEVTISETFVASGTGMVRFDLAYDGLWNIGAQPYLSCCDENGIVAGFFDPMWQIQGSLTLGGVGGFLSGENFFFTNVYDPDEGSVAGVLSAFGSVLDGQEYAISMSLLTQLIGGATGGIDFANTAVLTFTTDPGVSLTFSDDKFLSQMAAVPLPASGLLLLFSVFALAYGGMRFRAHANR